MTDQMQVVCAACATVNRIPTARRSEQPKCGKCGAMLFQGQPLVLTSANFDRHIRSNGVPVIVDFWADWCAPCRAMAPAFAQAAQELKTQVRFAKVDTQAQPVIASRFGVRSLPTLVLFQGGVEVARQAGAMGAADIISWIQGHGHLP